MKVGSWNINWERIYESPQISKEIRKNIQKNNFEKSKIINKFLKSDDDKDRLDIVALIEAEKNYAPIIEGYKQFYVERKDKYGGILIYINEKYNPEIDICALNEIKKNNIKCFLPIILTENNIIFHILFSWTTSKNKSENWYGLKRFRELLCSEELDFKNTREFLNAYKHDNVLVIGDLNVLFQNEFSNEERKKNWNSFIKIMKSYNLIWKENYENTYRNCGSNDHCFVSPMLYNRSILKVGEKEYDFVKSDHNMIYLDIDNDIRV